MKLIIGNKNYSSWSLRPWLLLSAHAMPFEEIRIPLKTPSTQQTIASYTEAGKVPVLHDGDLVVWDSLAICEYVSEQYLEGRGWPSDPKARAEARSYAAEMHSGFFELREKLPMNCRAVHRRVTHTPELDREIARINRIWGILREKNGDQGPWLYGIFSIVDCMFAPVVFRFRTYGVQVDAICREYMESMLSNKHIQHWLQEAERESERIEVAEAGE